MKPFRHLLNVVALSLICIASACDDDEPENPYSNEDEQQSESSTETTSSSTTNITELVKKNVSVTGSFSDFVWKVEIESTLESALPGRAIEYVLFLDCDREDLDCYTSDYLQHNKYQSYTKTTSGGKVKVTMECPFYYYYIHNDIKTFTEAEMYYASYLALLAKPESSLSDDEKQFLSQLRSSILKNLETEAQWMQCGAYVKIGTSLYKVYTSPNLRNVW